jgi:hypothetical protein
LTTDVLTFFFFLVDIFGLLVYSIQTKINYMEKSIISKNKKHKNYDFNFKR